MIHYVPFLFGTTGSVCHTSRLKPYRKIFFSRGCGNLLIINLRMFLGFFSSQLWSCIFKQQHIVQKGELVKTWCFLLALFTLGSQENEKKRPYLYPLLVFILLRCCFCTLITCSLSFHPHILFSASSHCSLSEKKVLHWYSLPHLNTLHPLSLSLPPLSQVCCVSSTSSCGGPDPASSTPHHLTSLGRPTTAARPLTPSRSA